jgi:uncharacterized membrane protein
MPWLPDWFYEPLPYLCVGGGILALYALQGILAQLSGVMLVLIGITIMYLRWAHRTKNRKRPAAGSTHRQSSATRAKLRRR